MNILVDHIQYLLRLHDCVILPGIGALIASHRAAVIGVDGEAITPPGRTLCFNPAISNNDGLIATSIARREGISFEAAREKVERLCGVLMQQLTDNREANIEGIGTLCLGDEENISFLPAAEYTSPLFYGLQPLTLPTLEYLQSQSQAQSQSQGQSRSFTKDPRYFYLKLRKSVVRAAACILVATCVGTALWQAIPTDSNIDTASLFPVPAKTENVQPSKAPKVVVKKAEKQSEVKAPEVVAGETAQEASESTAPEPGTYYLIVASAHTRAEIDRFLAMHTDDDSLRIVETASMIRVYSDKSADRNDLLPAMRDTDLLVRYPGSWIWKAPK